jgi:hypothetical protein
MGVPGRRRRRTTGEHEAMTPGPILAPAPTLAPTPPVPEPPRAPSASKPIVFAALLVLALSALLGGAWLIQASVRSNPGAGQHAP